MPLDILGKTCKPSVAGIKPGPQPPNNNKEPMSGWIKRTKLDDVFSRLVRERAEWSCEVCDKYFPEGHRQGLHCAHFYSRRHQGLRFFPDNACAMCYACHQRLGGNPVEFAKFIEAYLGKVWAEKLYRASKKTIKITRAEKEEIYHFLKDELSRITLLRNTGKTGRIEFRAPKIIQAKLKQALKE